MPWVLKNFLKECLGGGWGNPVLNLQEQLRRLEVPFINESLAAEDRSPFSLFQSMSAPHLAEDAPRLQVLQAQLNQVHARQEQLLQQVDSFTRSPGLAPPLWTGTPQGRWGRSCLLMGNGVFGSEFSSLARRASRALAWGKTMGAKTGGEDISYRTNGWLQTGLCETEGSGT